MLGEGLLTEPLPAGLIFHMLGEGLLAEPSRRTDIPYAGRRSLDRAPPARLRVALYRRIPADNRLATAIKRFQHNRVTIAKTGPA